MSITSQARAVQKTTGRKFQATRTEVERRHTDISDLKIARPEMSRSDCAVAVCFETRADLRSRWGDIFRPNEVKP